MRARQTPTPTTALMEANEMKSSAPLLHFVSAIDERRGTIGFCCETQPLATVRSYGHPQRCPLCQQENPVYRSLSIMKGLNHKEKI